MGTDSTVDNSIVSLALKVVFILLVPLVAMQFTDEVNWDFADFVIMGALLFGVGFTYDIVSKKTSNSAYKYAARTAWPTA